MRHRKKMEHASSNPNGKLLDTNALNAVYMFSYAYLSKLETIRLAKPLKALCVFFFFGNVPTRPDEGVRMSRRVGARRCRRVLITPLFVGGRRRVCLLHGQESSCVGNCMLKETTEAYSHSAIRSLIVSLTSASASSTTSLFPSLLPAIVYLVPPIGIVSDSRAVAGGKKHTAPETQ